ncbi:imidazole glycerol phosphate synthase subunit HisH [Campylobacter sp. FMV-PI01]|uniref:Imidazole glycerol phosphate synthase subunit HisH n=1 Tax=Campylobacter portucalensis TaxID=2608384 RepID=A0A6L5WF57_9BACT|nr:imidazole glycerol phosphate synthase subunit HisH [Campylobacter portucalensis]MSN95600.1 imidazole glycerol phosphate synthase subunit HisH [Campylobacter portucalensis]
MKIGVIDYGAGNLKSVVNAFEFCGVKVEIIKDGSLLLKCDKIVLPGVGAFKKAIELLRKDDLDLAIKEFISQKKPFLGICLGMQLLFERGFEFGVVDGLGVLKGDIVKFDCQNLKIPHVGWNTLNFKKNSDILNEIKSPTYLYFTHSFHVKNCDENDILATTFYGYDFVSAVSKDNVFAFQPHPEKSHEAGLRIIKNFMEI